MANRTSFSILAIRVVGALGLCVGVLVLSRFPFDDAFIHMRIARNLAFEGRPYFNVGERVMGGSSPIWLVSVAGLFRLVGSPSPWVVTALECVVVSLLSFAADIWLSTAAGRASIASSLLGPSLVAGLVLTSAGFLMEPGLALLFALLGVLSLGRQKYVLGGVALALASATRFELGLLAAVAWLFVQGVRAKARFLIGFLSVLGCEALLLLHWYGTLVPNTVRAKSIVYPLTLAQFLQSVPGLPSLHGISLLAWIAGGIICAALTTSKLWDVAGETRRLVAIFGLFSAGLLLAYTAKRTAMFQWYWPVVALPAALAVAATAQRLWSVRAEARVPRSVRVWGYVAVGCVSCVSLPAAARAANAVLNAARNRPERSATLEASLRLRPYFAIADRLFRECPNGTLMTSEIGAVGWNFRGKLIDGLGLVSPQVLKYHPMRVPEQRSKEDAGGIPAQAVADLQPDYVVGMEIFLTDFLRRRGVDPRLTGYHLIDSRPVLIEGGVARPLWDSNLVLTFARQDACRE